MNARRRYCGPPPVSESGPYATTELTTTEGVAYVGMRYPLSLLDLSASYRVLRDVLAERGRQDARWGRQDHPQGTGPDTRPLGLVPYHAVTASAQSEHFRRMATIRSASERLTWADILLEETFEAFAEDDPEKLRAELVQVAAVAVAMIESLDRGVSAPSEKVGPKPGYGRGVYPEEWQ